MLLRPLPESFYALRVDSLSPRSSAFKERGISRPEFQATAPRVVVPGVLNNGKTRWKVVPSGPLRSTSQWRQASSFVNFIKLTILSLMYVGNESKFIGPLTLTP